jgi:hypothetical protein
MSLFSWTTLYSKVTSFLSLFGKNGGFQKYNNKPLFPSE